MKSKSSDVHIEDGLALTRFMFWVKENAGKGITEKDAADYLDNERAKISDFIELSFETISAYGANAAMMHYSATKDNCAILKPEGMLLVDSGGTVYAWNYRCDKNNCTWTCKR